MHKEVNDTLYQTVTLKVRPNFLRSLNSKEGTISLSLSNLYQCHMLLAAIQGKGDLVSFKSAYIGILCHQPYL